MQSMRVVGPVLEASMKAPPPSPSAQLPLNVQLRSVGLATNEWTPPPFSRAWLSWKMFRKTSG
ncbi:MAG: hypothetical protein FJY88_10465 [Candidatus Eisenbacteria bacterium]|nr:hypothetical protein [Candidatus Eisenbacteria bacterium]